MSLWEGVFLCPPNPDICDGESEEEIEEEIEDGTERPTKKQIVKENKEKMKGHNALEIEKETEQKNYVSDFEEESVSSISRTSSRPQRDLQMERKLKAAQEDLKILRRDQVKMKEALNKERKEKHALSKALKNEQAQKVTLRIEMECTKMRMTDVEKSEKVHQERQTKLQKKIKEMTADHKSKEEKINKLKRTISKLQENDTMQASDLKEEQSKNVTLQMDYEAAASQLQRDNEAAASQLQRDYEAAASQQLERDKKEQVRLEDALKKSRLAEQDIRETCRELEEKLKREKGRLSGATEEIGMQRKATEDMRYDIQKLRLENRNIRTRYEALKAKYALLYKGEAPCPTESNTKQTQRQEEIQRAIAEEIVNQTASALEREKERVNQTASALARERERADQASFALVNERAILDQTSSALERERERADQASIALEKESARLDQTFSALERERERADQTSMALEKERARSDKCHVELNKALVQHTKTQEEKHHLALDLQISQNKLDSQTQEQTKVALHKATEALHSLQKENTDLRRKHGEIHSDYREVLKSHSTHQIRYERLDCATGDLGPDVSRSKFNLGWSKLGSSFRDSKTYRTVTPVRGVSLCPPNPDIFDGESEEEIEEEIEYGTERPTKKQIVKENKEKMKGHNALEIEKETEQKTHVSDFEEESVSSSSRNSEIPQRDLQMERKLKAAQEDLKILRRDQVKMKEALNKERKEKHALSKALKNEQAQKVTLRIELECTKMRMTDVEKSEKVHQERQTKLQKKIKEMTADHKSKEEKINKLKRTISKLQENDTMQASDLKEEQSKNVTLQMDYEAAASQLQRDNEAAASQLQRDYEAAASQQLERDKKELVRLEDALNKSRLAEQDIRETCRELEEKLKGEKGRLSGATEEIGMQRKATEDMTYDIQKLRLENRNIRTRYEALKAKYALLNKGEAPCPTESNTKQTQRQEEIQRAIAEEIVNQTASALEREKERVNQTASALARERERADQASFALVNERAILDQTSSALERERERADQASIALEKESARLDQTFSALERERERADQTSMALEKERARSDKCHVELNKALVQQTKTQEEKHRLALDLQISQNKLDSQTQEQTKVALRKATEALHSLQKENTDLRRKHGEIHSDYREVLKSHSTHQIRCERLDCATGDLGPDVSRSKFNLGWSKLGSSFRDSKTYRTVTAVRAPSKHNIIKRTRLEAAYKMLASLSDMRTFAQLEEEVEREEQERTAELLLRLSPTSLKEDASLDSEPGGLFQRGSGSPMEASVADHPPQTEADPHTQAGPLSMSPSTPLRTRRL
ncbi:trichohyalin-like [Platichthys flesus]|uniref:trichohyalin-like n=1 Tax=Platichthys flesus TaxID=8260 RepID=UPI002DBB5940|nr:trichohyalin-like [Platichthys flesus]